MKNGIVVVAELGGAASARVLEVQSWADPRLAAGTPPHLTLVGSSGAGPMPEETSAERIRELVEPITNGTAPITVRLERPHRFMQTDIMVLPIDPHGPLRTLHERIVKSGLEFERPRFPFSPHVTLSFFPRLSPAVEKRLLAVRVGGDVPISAIQFYRTDEAFLRKLVLTLDLKG